MEGGSTEGTPLMGEEGKLSSSQQNLYRDVLGRILEHEEMYPPVEVDTLYNDEVNTMTYGRRLARILSNFAWYNPRRSVAATTTTAPTGSAAEESSKPEAASQGLVDTTTGSEHGKPPSIDAAWAYFEHVILARHMSNPTPAAAASARARRQSLTRRTHVRRDEKVKAEAGELQEATQLYNVWNTSENDLADFGIGVGLYFFHLRSLAVICLLAGILSLPTVFYYASSAYDSSNQGSNGNHLKFVLRGTAICTDSSWAACPTCTRQDWDRFPSSYDRYASVNTTDGRALSFIQVNHCELRFWEGLFTWITLIFVAVSVYTMDWISRRRHVNFDAAAQTTTDYSLEVENPPVDAFDADQWKAFFEQYDQVNCVTVAMDNEHLIKALIQRRALVRQLENMLPPSVKFDKYKLDEAVQNAAPLQWWEKYIMQAADAKSLRDQIAKLDEEVMKLSKERHHVSNVFVTFETEEGQRRALKELMVPFLDTLLNRKRVLPPSARFRGEHVLLVREPPEPSAVRWQDLDESVLTKLFQRFVTFILTVAVLFGGCLSIAYSRKRYGYAITAIVITAINSIAPMICTQITMYESHSSEGSMQASLYVKISACLWVSTAIITAIVTPFTQTLSREEASMIPAMFAIFITEMLKAPITQVLDLPGHVYRHVLGPRAPDQRRMNLYFQGTPYQLSERYTDLTNVLFLTFYYCAIFPTGYFFAAATLTVHYWTDKFCLLRNWTPGPMIGASISNFSRNYFFTMAILVYSVISSYNIASFPYDNACEDSGTVSDEYIGDFDAVNGDGHSVQISILPGDTYHRYCNQDMLRYIPHVFPAIPSNQPEGASWMSESQENLARIFGWTSVVFLVLVGLIYFNRIFLKLVRYIFFRPPMPQGEPSPERFTEVTEIFGYVPQVRIPGYEYPTLFCDTSSIGKSLVGWTDPKDSFDEHNAMYDVPELTKVWKADAHDKHKPPMFSIVKHWAPANKDE